MEKGLIEKKLQALEIKQTELEEKFDTTLAEILHLVSTLEAYISEPQKIKLEDMVLQEFEK